MWLPVVVCQSSKKPAVRVREYSRLRSPARRDMSRTVLEPAARTSRPGHNSRFRLLKAVTNEAQTPVVIDFARSSRCVGQTLGQRKGAQ